MARLGSAVRLLLCLAGLGPPIVVAAVPAPIDASPAALARAMAGHPVVLLGEVHDNGTQHALRLAALRELLATGARPALALEQLDRERQADVERARRERPGDADYLITQAKGNPGWNWAFYRPYVALALEFDLPIVAANLSRGDAMKVALDGWPAAFDAATARELRLDALPADFRRRHETAIALGHCNLLPPEALPAQANAQIARDLVLARSIRPYAGRGVVLLAGNGHVRTDIGVPYWLTADERRRTIAIGVLERDDGDADPDAETPDAFDAYVLTARAERPDPCLELERRMKPAAAPK